MVTRAGVIPTSIRDETGAIARHEAEANNRMAMLFYTLLAKREDRMFMAALRQQMTGEANAEWYRREDYRNQNRTQNQRPGYSSPGAQGSDYDDDSGSVTSPRGGAPTIPGSPGIPDHTKFSEAAGDAAPINLSDEARNAFAQAPTQTPQQIQEGKAANKLRPSNAAKAPTTQLPRVRNPRTPAPDVQYRNMTPEILAAWQDAEKKYGLPPGQLLFTHGLETDGGRILGRADGKGPQGPFQWTPKLLAEKGLTVRDAQDYVKMGYASAKNMAENHDQLVKRTKMGGQAVQLTDSVADMKSWHVLHQWGRSGGPAIVAASKLNPGMPLTELLPKNVLRRNGTRGDASEWLVNNGLHPEATVAMAYRQLEERGHPYRTAAVTGQGVLPENGGIQTSAPQQQQVPQQQQPQQRGVPRPQETVPPSNDAVAWLESRAKPGTNMRGLNPEYANSMANLLQKAEAATGVRARITSGHRTYEEQAELRRRYESGRGGLAARPGRSRHEGGNAIDVGHGPVLQYLRENRQLVAQHGGEFLTGRAGAVDRVHIQRSGTRPQGYGVFLGKSDPRVPASMPQTAQAPADVQAKAQTQPRVSVEKYPSPTRMPSEVRTDVTADFRGPTSKPWDGVTGTAVAAPAPAAPTTQQQPPPAPQQPMPPGIRPENADMQAPPGWSPPVDVPMPPPRPMVPPTQVQLPMPPPRPDMEAQGAPSFDEAGFNIPPPELFTGAQSVDEAGMQLPPAMGAPSVDEAGMQLPPPINSLDVGTGEDYAGAQSVDEAGMEQHGQRKELPGTSIGNIRQPYTRADRRDMAARGEQPEPQWRPPGTVSPIAGARDWIADMVERAKGGGAAPAGDGGAQPMPSAPLPPISDMPMPPDVAGGDVGEDGGDIAAAPDLPPPSISDMPMPPQGDGGGVPQGPPSPSALAAMKDAIFNSASMPQFDPQRAQENRQAVQGVIDPAVQMYRNAAPNIGAKIQEIAGAIFKKGTPSVTGKGQASAPTNAPMMPGRPVKVERYNYNPDGSKRFDDGPPIAIPNPNQGRATTSTTPLPFNNAPAAAAPAASAPIPPPPRPGAGAGQGFKKWRLRDGRIVATRPGEAPPPGAEEVK